MNGNTLGRAEHVAGRSAAAAAAADQADLDVVAAGREHAAGNSEVVNAAPAATVPALRKSRRLSPCWFILESLRHEGKGMRGTTQRSEVRGQSVTVFVFLTSDL